jgi:hypothetical protein
MVTVSACRRASPDWNGTWKLSISKTDIPGPSLTVAISPSGEYHTQAGASDGNFRCDGKEYPQTANLTVICTQGSTSVMEIILERDRTRTGTARWELSSDGKVLTIKSTSIDAHGLTKSKEGDYVRTSASTGFAGEWRNAKPFEGMPSLMQLTLNSGRLHYAFPENAQHADPALDGSDATVYGPGVPSGTTIAFKQNGIRELLMTKKRNGQIIAQGSLTISKDGRTLSETHWRPERPDARAVTVYEKQ